MHGGAAEPATIIPRTRPQAKFAAFFRLERVRPGVALEPAVGFLGTSGLSGPDTIVAGQRLDGHQDEGQSIRPDKKKEPSSYLDGSFYVFYEPGTSPTTCDGRSLLLDHRHAACEVVLRPP